MRALTYALPVAAVLFGVGLLVRSEWDPLIRLDDAIIERATAYTRPREGLTDFLVRWQELTQPFKLYLVGTALCLWAWLAKGLRTRAAWAFITMIVVLLLLPLLRSTASRVVAVTAAVAMVTVTASDRVLLGVHFPSDVTVGVITGVGLVLASYAGYRRQEGQ